MIIGNKCSKKLIYTSEQGEFQTYINLYISFFTFANRFSKINIADVMIQIDDILVSDELKDTYFACKLSACKGDCCVQGDAGAPLEEGEISILEDYIDEIKPYMEPEARKVIELMGVFDYDSDAEYVTPLVDDDECAFVYIEKGVSLCAIEKAWIEGKIKFQKPVSCHLYPIRLSKVGDFTAVNYNKWSICAPALINGKKQGDPLYKYLKAPLERKFGKEWYEKLTIAMEEEK